MSLFEVTNQGVITADTADIKDEFIQAYKAALGAELNTDSSSVAGQLITNDTKILTTVMEQVVAIANETNVYYATGQALDVAASFYGYYRKQGVPTTVVVKFSGTENTVIPAETIVSDGTYEYKTLEEKTIPVSGIVYVEAQCTTPGKIICPAGTVTTLDPAIEGIDIVTNENDGIVGYDTENDNIFRDRITANFLNKRARSILGAIIDNIAAINNVVSVVGVENPSDETVTRFGVQMTPHSIFVTVLGGNGSDIAKVLTEQKTIGATTIGDTTVTYVDQDIGYNYEYQIFRPTQVPLYCQVQYSANEYTPAGVSDQIIGLISEYIQNNSFKIGQTISGNLLAQALADFNKINLLAIKLSTDGTTWADYVATSKTQIATLSTSNITTTEI